MSAPKPSSKVAPKPAAIAPARRGDADAWFTLGKLMWVLAGLILLAFPDVVFLNKAFYYRDAGMFNYPNTFYLRESLWRGELPLWNPLNNCGIPFLAQWNVMALYPFSLFNVLMPFPTGVVWFSFLHILLAGAGMYLLALRWTQSRLGASVAGLLFAWNGLALHSLMWPNTLVTFGWLPWVVWLSDGAWKEAGRFIIYASVVAALQILAGVPEPISATWVFLAGVFAVERVREPKRFWPAARRMTVVVAAVTGLTAAQMLPFIDLLSHSQRSTGYVSSAWSMPLWGWANLFVPLFHTRPSIVGVFAQNDQQWTASYYFGIAAIALAFIAVRRVGTVRVIFLAVMSVVALILALGHDAYVFAWLLKAMPFLGFFRYPVKLVLLVMICLPLLAAYAVGWLASNKSAEPPVPRKSYLQMGGVFLFIVAFIVAIEFFFPIPEKVFPAVLKNGIARAVFFVITLFAIARLAAAQRPGTMRFWGMAIVLLLGLDILTHAPRLVHAVPAKEFGPVELIMDRKPHPGEGRAMLSQALNTKMMFVGHPDHSEYFLVGRKALFANANLLDGVPKLNGTYSLYIKEQAEVVLETYTGEAEDIPDPLKNFLGVEQISYPNPYFAWDRRTNFMPMVTVGQKPVFVSEAESFTNIFSPTFDPENVVYLPREAEAAVQARSLVEKCSVSFVNYSEHDMAYKVITPEPTMLVLAQTYYHPWKAFIDGKPAPIWRANHAFQAVEVPPGEHVVRLVYRDEKFLFGAALSLFTLVVCGVAWWRMRATKAQE